MNVLACSYHCWFPGRLNGRCSGAVRMNGWPLSSHDNLLPTALILHRGHWSASYWFFLFLSFLLFPPLYICLSLSQICLPWPRRSSWRRWPVTTATSNMAGQTERMATTTQGWVSPVHTHAVSAWHVWLQSYNASRGCCLYASPVPCQYHLSSCVYVWLQNQTDWNQDVTSPLLLVCFLWETFNEKQTTAAMSQFFRGS